MNITRTLLFLFVALVSPLSHAANSVLIWPIDPRLSSGEKATELWLENRGETTTLMQVRVLGWMQNSGRERYETQQRVVASPPMVRIEPGKRQLVRLIMQTPPPAGQEAAYRVLLDEIPRPQTPGENQAGLMMQMRYSVPLFVYGTGLAADTAKPVLSWRVINAEGKSFLEITNRGSGHARLSNVTLGGRSLGQGLFGYVLANSSYRWPLTFPASSRSQLTAEMNKTRWRSSGAE